MSLSLDELRRFAAGLADSPERWRHLIRHNSDLRVYEQIWDDEDVNAWVICWSEDQDTGFHDHDESAAGIAVVSGHVREDRLTLTGSPVSREIGPGTTFTLPPVAIHRVLHAGTGPAVTIHAYSPPLRRTGAYRVGADGALERESQAFEVELRGEPVPA
jgi:mannose-6-phosphate isomerase-like protein (cupin superfamily)